MKRIALLAALAVALVTAAAAGAKPLAPTAFNTAVRHYAWHSMSLADRAAGQRQLVVDDWRIITTWRSNALADVVGSLGAANEIHLTWRKASSLLPPEPYPITWRYRHMKWTQRELGQTRRALAKLERQRAPTSSASGQVGVDSCTMTLLGREGGMNPHATNPYSGAYGGPQALPGEKMASAGADWRDNIWTQIRWMIDYMNARYGGSCAALQHSYAYGWY